MDASFAATTVVVVVVVVVLVIMRRTSRRETMSHFIPVPEPPRVSFQKNLSEETNLLTCRLFSLDLWSLTFP